MFRLEVVNTLGSTFLVLAWPRWPMTAVVGYNEKPCEQLCGYGWLLGTTPTAKHVGYDVEFAGHMLQSIPVLAQLKSPTQ